MKEAQDEVLGNNAKRDVRPARDDRSVLAPRPLVCGFTSVSTRRSSRPGRPVFFERHPSTSYWATFIGSLRDRLLSAHGLTLGCEHPHQHRFFAVCEPNLWRRFKRSVVSF